MLCWIFSESKDSLATGFNDWIHLQQTLSQHERKNEHNLSYSILYKWRLNRTIDYELEKAIREEESFWRKILTRTIDVTLTLASCNFPFCGHDESLNSQNPGVFLSMIYLLSRYDPIFKSLLEGRTQDSVTSFSPAIQNEIIDMLENSVREKIISDVRQSPFFSVILDSTQDIAKIDQ